MFLRSWFTAAMALDESDTENLKCSCMATINICSGLTVGNNTD